MNEAAVEPTSPRLLLVFAIGLAVSFAVPPIAFLVIGLIEGMGPAAVVSAMIDQYATDRLNLSVLGVTGVVPFALLVVALALLKRFAGPASVRGVAWGAGTVVTLLLLWAHWTFWPTFLPDRVYPGWPHGIEFVIVPLFFAPVGALAGGIAGFFIDRGHRTP